MIRPLTDADRPYLSRIGGHPAVAPMMWQITTPWPEAAVGAWIAAAPWRDRPGFRLGIALYDGTLIGAIGVGGTPLGISYFIDPAQTGRGYATEAASAVISLCRDHLHMNALTADHFSDNPASGRVLQKLGFLKTGQDFGTSAARPAPAPILLYSLTL